jgi:peroxiredoxin
MTTASMRSRTQDAAFRRQLEQDAVWSRMVAPGARLPSMPLLEVDLGPIHLDRLRTTGPVVLIFFRYESSPHCDAALAEYQDELLPALTLLGAHLVAVSPQRPDRLAEIKHRHDLGYFVASDPRHVLIDAFGIGFSSPGVDQVLGTGRSVLPYPTVVVADRAGVVRYADVHPDWSVRTAPRPIIAAVRQLVRPSA